MFGFVYILGLRMMIIAVCRVAVLRLVFNFFIFVPLLSAASQAD
jgi:hypothetical protein